MIPLADDNTDRTTTPVINYLLLALNILVFVLFQGLGSNMEFTYAWSTVPAEIISGEDKVTGDRTIQDPVSGSSFQIPGLQPTPAPVYLTLLSAIFMHGGFLHLAGNMLYLWIFGDNLEHRMGRLRYLAFYLVCGIIASLAHVFTTVIMGGNTLIPSLGASGAISGVLGGYLLLHPHRRVTVLLFRFITHVPAMVAIGLWFVFQLVSGMGLLGNASQQGGVAYAAHIGGFIAGLILVKLFDRGEPERVWDRYSR